MSEPLQPLQSDFIQVIWNAGYGVLGGLFTLAIAAWRFGARMGRLEEQAEGNRAALTNLKGQVERMDDRQVEQSREQERRMEHQFNNLQTSLMAIQSTMTSLALRQRSERD
jgi:hypothetical protein